MSAQLKVEEQWQVAAVFESQINQAQEKHLGLWRERLVSIWEAVWHLAFGAKVLRFNEETGRYEEVQLHELHRSQVAITERVF